MWIESASDIYIFLIYFENFISQSYFMILFYFILLYFVFKAILFYSLYGFTALDRHFINGIIFTKFDWLPPGRRDSVASDRILTLLKLSKGL